MSQKENKDGKSLCACGTEHDRLRQSERVLWQAVRLDAGRRAEHGLHHDQGWRRHRRRNDEAPRAWGPVGLVGDVMGEEHKGGEEKAKIAGRNGKKELN